MVSAGQKQVTSYNSSFMPLKTRMSSQSIPRIYVACSIFLGSTFTCSNVTAWVSSPSKVALMALINPSSSTNVSPLLQQVIASTMQAAALCPGYLDATASSCTSSRIFLNFCCAMHFPFFFFLSSYFLGLTTFVSILFLYTFYSFPPDFPFSLVLWHWDVLHQFYCLVELVWLNSKLFCLIGLNMLV